MHIDGWAWNFTNSTVTCFRSLSKLSKLSAWPPLASKKQSYAYKWNCESVFWLQKDKFLPNRKWARLRGHSASVVELAEHLYVFGVCTIHALVRLTWGEGQDSPVHPVVFALSVIIDKTSSARKDVSVHRHCFGFRSECRWRQKSVSASLRGIK